MDKITLDEFVNTVDGEGLEYAIRHYFGPRYTIINEPELTKKIQQVNQLLEEIEEILLTNAGY